jgi:hypothetical protein
MHTIGFSNATDERWAASLSLSLFLFFTTTIATIATITRRRTTMIMMRMFPPPPPLLPLADAALEGVGGWVAKMVGACVTGASVVGAVDTGAYDAGGSVPPAVGEFAGTGAGVVGAVDTGANEIGASEVGTRLGAIVVGACDPPTTVGGSVGMVVGTTVGAVVGMAVGDMVGMVVGTTDGGVVGMVVGGAVGMAVGVAVVGTGLGACVGVVVGVSVPGTTVLVGPLNWVPSTMYTPLTVAVGATVVDTILVMFTSTAPLTWNAWPAKEPAVMTVTWAPASVVPAGPIVPVSTAPALLAGPHWLETADVGHVYPVLPGKLNTVGQLSSCTDAVVPTLILQHSKRHDEHTITVRPYSRCWGGTLTPRTP